MFWLKELNLSIEKGDDWSKSLIVKDIPGNLIDLTGFTFAASMINQNDQEKTSVIIEVTSDDSIITLSIPEETTKTLSVGRWIYDVIAISEDNERTKIFKGVITVNETVT